MLHSLTRRTRLLGTALRTMMAVLLVSCGDSPTGPAKTRTPERLALEVRGNVSMSSLGDSISLSVRVLDAAGRQIDGLPLEYYVTGTGVMESLGNGLFRATGNGNAWLVAKTLNDVPRPQAGGLALVRIADSVAVTVSQVPAALAVQPFDTIFYALGLTRQASAMLSDARGNAVPGALAKVDWSVGDSTIVGADSLGRITARGDGATQITATYAALRKQWSVTVSATFSVSKCVTFLVGASSEQRCAVLPFTVQQPTTSP